MLALRLIQPMDEDLALLEAWRGGDRAAGSRLLARRVREITWFFRNKVFDETDVADLVGQTFLGCVGSRDHFRGDTSFRRFLYSIAENTLRKYLRTKAKRAREQIDFAQVCISELEPRSLSSIAAMHRELRAFFSGLREVPIDDQVVLELKYFEGLSARELGEVLGIPEATVRGRLRRGLDRLRERVHLWLERDGGEAQVPSAEDLEAWAATIRERRSA